MALVAAGTGDRKDLEGNDGNAALSSKVAACVSFYAATNAGANLFPEGTDRATIDAASAANTISPTFAPTIFLHGLADTTIRPESTLDFFQKLRGRRESGPAPLPGRTACVRDNNPDAALASHRSRICSSTG